MKRQYVLMADINISDRHYLKEWLNYHLTHGFDKILLFEENRSQYNKRIVNSCFTPSKVKLIERKDISWIKEIEHTFVIRLATDQYINGDFRSIVKDVNTLYTISCHVCNANGLYRRPESIKAFKGTGFSTIIYASFYYVQENMNFLKEYKVPITDLKFDWYMTKSLSEWLERKHSSYKTIQELLFEFFVWNPTMFDTPETDNFIKNYGRRKSKLYYQEYLYLLDKFPHFKLPNS